MSAVTLAAPKSEVRSAPPAGAWQDPLWTWKLIGLYLGLAFFILFLCWWAGHQRVLTPRKLMQAYPEAIRRVQYLRNGWQVELSSGQTLPFSDPRPLSYDQRLEHMDLASLLKQPYIQGRVELPVRLGHDPGRLRNYDLLKAAYGSTSDEVEQNLEIVPFLGRRVRFNRKNGAARALAAVAKELEKEPDLRQWVGHLGEGSPAQAISTWNWRTIAGTQRLSAHSFGIAVDLDNPFAQRFKYWRWGKFKDSTQMLDHPVVLDPLPWRLIEVFEQHGFIWGGKWHHFDCMHFEYRPELFMTGAERVRAGSRSRAPVITPAGLPGTSSF